MSRRLEPVLPERLKVMGPAHLRWREDEIAKGPLGDGGQGQALRPAAPQAAA
jgi:hypothetical protein